MYKSFTFVWAMLFFNIISYAQDLSKEMSELIAQAELLTKQEQFEASRKLFEKGLAIAEREPEISEFSKAQLKSGLAQVFWRMGQHGASERLYQEAIDDYFDCYCDTLALAQVYNNFSLVLKETGQYERAGMALNASLDLRKAKLGASNLAVGESYYNMALYYWELGQLDLAFGYINKAFDLFKLKLGPAHFYLSICYDVMGNLAVSKGDAHQAMRFYRASIRNLASLNLPEFSTLGFTYSNMGNVYGEWGQFEKSYEHFQKSLSIRLKTYGPVHHEVAETYTNLAAIQSIEGDYEAAIENNLKAINIWEALDAGFFGKIGIAYNRTGKAYMLVQRLDEATAYFNKALEVLSSFYGAKHPEIALTYYHLAENYVLKKEEDQANIYFDKALDQLDVHRAVKDSNAYVSSVNFAVEILNGQINYLEGRFNETQDTVWLNKLYRQCRLANTFFEKYKYTEVEPSSWRSYFKNIKRVYEREIMAAAQLFSMDKNQLYLENSYQTNAQVKGNMLVKSFNESQAKSFYNMPDSLLEAERQLKSAVQLLESRQFELAQGGSENDSLFTLVEESLFQKRLSLKKVKDKLSSSYPDYFQMVYENESVTIKNIQEEILTEDQALLEYFVGDSTIVLFLIKKQEINVKYIKRDFPLEEWVQQLREGITGYWLSKDPGPELEKICQDKYINAAHQLYGKLLAPSEDDLKGVDRVIIIPDGLLGYIPFAALLREKPSNPNDYNSYSYWIKDKAISYAYAASLLLKMKTKKSSGRKLKSCLSIAPVFEKLQVNSSNNLVQHIIQPRSNHIPLLHAEEEANKVYQMFGGDLWIGAMATVSSFKKHAHQYKMIHLATHGKANDINGNYSYVAFSELTADSTNTQLFVSDLYNLSLNADLVTLSACETGVGPLQEGEGIIGQTSGFFYAGARSLLTTHWSISDGSTLELMTHFYHQIKEGVSKDLALQKAQVQYMQTSLQAHPFFWAGFMLAGDTNPVSVGQTAFMLTTGMLLLLAGLLCSFLIDRRHL